MVFTPTKVRVPLLCLAAIALWATPNELSAQSVDGRIVGLGGRATGATVTVLTGGGEVIGEVLVEADGTFAYEGPSHIGSIVVRQEAVAVKRGIVGGSATQVAIDLQAAMRWSRSVAVLDPDGQPAVGVDVIARDDNNVTVACVTSDDRGMLTLRGSQTVANLVVDPMGWHHEVKVGFAAARGPDDAVPDLVIDLKPFARQFVLLQGRLVDLAGDAIADARVTASKLVDRQSIVCGTTKSRADGTFRLWSGKGATLLSARSGGLTLLQAGNWQKQGANDLLLHESRDAVVLVTGKVVDADGKPAKNAVLYTSEASTVPRGKRGIAGTDDEGRFRVFLRRATPFLVAHLRDGGGKASQAGPWPQPAVVLRGSK